MARLLTSTTTTLLVLALTAMAASAHEPWKGGFQCPAKKATTAAPDETGLCKCAEGWAGPDCGVCTEDAACAAFTKGSTCAQTTFAPAKNADGWCEITSKEVTDLLHGSAFVQMKFEQEEEGSDFSFHFIKKHDDTGVFVPIFRCQSDKTTVDVNHGTGMVTYKSPDLECELTCEPGSDRSCSKILQGVVKAVGLAGGSTIKCDPFNRSCNVEEATLKMFLNGAVKTENCMISECLAPAAATTTKKGGKLRHYN